MKTEQQIEQQATQRSLTAGDDHFTEMVMGTTTVRRGPIESSVVNLPGFDHRSASESEIVRAFHGARKP